MLHIVCRTGRPKKNKSVIHKNTNPRKKSGSFFSKFRELFRFFWGNFLKYRDISKILPETSRKIPYDIRRVHLVFFPWKKTKSINIIIFPFILLENIYFREISTGISRNFREQNFWLMFSFFDFFRETSEEKSGN